MKQEENSTIVTTCLVVIVVMQMLVRIRRPPIHQYRDLSINLFQQIVKNNWLFHHYFFPLQVDALLKIIDLMDKVFQVYS